eukprot:CAMPEP_0178537046 /NCGR_PEP_ID=MMETSP0696-20121128/36395_1 /TAXON_ID=265572 /ORGANISM="Extubocellulus spinifer, Strain CCMP396" /LENGTH=871 /DNA_ID=CAMNT_0020169277 /DNA_START=56 /DNA_END=2671 /DNA_ORIENTATION=+
MSNDLTATLQACQSPDLSVRTAAEQALQSAEQNNFPEFTGALATELSTEGKAIQVRQLAGIHFKNLLYAKDEAVQTGKHDKWKSMDATTRAAVKALLLQAIRSPEQIARHTAAQACAEVAAIELPYNEWPEFLSTMMTNVTSADHPDGVKVATLECLGFACERLGEIDAGPSIAAETTDQMLTTIVDGIRADRPDNIRCAAATALRNSLLFTRKNMETPQERNMIMQTICEATQSQDVKTRTAAYECIVQIAYQYYHRLADYMQTIFQLTFNTIKTDEEPVALQAIEFWSTLCEEEQELLDEAADAEERGVELEPGRECVRYVAAALEHLTPLLTETMTKQDEDVEAGDEEWNLAMAAASCLQLVAETVEDLIVPAIMPFVQANIKNENWRYREAATMAFGSILTGPSPDAIGQFVNQSIPVLLEALSDPHILVRDTTAWVIGKICELHVRSVPSETFPSLVNTLSSKLLSETPRVSSQACFGLHNIAAAFADDSTAEATGTNAISPYMANLLQTLLQVADRQDAGEANLRVGAFEAVSMLIQNSAPDVKPVLLQLLPAIVDRLAKTFSMQTLSNDDKEQKEGLQGLLCGVIQVLCLKLTKEDILPHADAIMTNILQVLQSKNATCHEEAFSATSAVADQLEADFEKYMPALQPFLLMGLRNFEAYHVCVIAVGLVGDIARSIESKLQPYCDDIMSALLQSLQNQSLHRSVKPPVLSSFGDIALAIGGQFELYLQVSLMMLFQASQTRAPEDDDELIEYVNSLREGILEAYTGIVQGLKDGGKAAALMPYTDAIFSFLDMLSQDETRDIEVLGKAVGLLGDVASTVGSAVKEYLSRPFVSKLLADAHATGDATIMETCTWAGAVIQQALQS